MLTVKMGVSDCQHSSSILENTNISSMKIITHTSNSSKNMEFMRYMKYVGALVNPKDITMYSYDPYRVENTIFGISPSLIQIW